MKNITKSSISAPILCLTSAIIALVLLAGCGGGGTTSGSGGSTGTAANAGASSSIVIELSDGFVINDRGLSKDTDISRIAAVLSEFFINSAVAQSAGIEVYVDDILVGTTDAEGRLAVAVDPGSHRVCIQDNTDDGKCVEINVGADEVVVVSGVDFDVATDTLEYTVSTESAFENIVLFEDPDKAHKTLVCHKGEMTISIGTPAALNGHMAHGDTPGECPVVAVNDVGNQQPPAGAGGEAGGDPDTPGNSGNSPGNSGNAPGNSGNSPGTGNAPGNSGNAPGNQGSA